MITNEMKAKIAAMYLGCKVQTPDGIGDFWCVATDGWIYAKCEGMQSEEYRCDEYQLILTPLSEITDEDAIEVAKMHYENREEMINNSPDRYIENVKEHVLQPIGLLPYYFVDFLRSKGYALPYMGIDLFESSLAIPKQ